MPFHPDDPADDIGYIRDQRQRAARRILAQTRFAAGDEVEILTPRPEPGLALHEPRGIVVGMTQDGDMITYRVMCSLATGLELPLVFADADLGPLTH